MLTHRNLVANILQSTACSSPVTGRATRSIGVLPFFHIYGMVVIMNAVLRNGATLVTMPRFDLEEFLGLVQEHRATKACRSCRRSCSPWPSTRSSSASTSRA